MEIGVFAEDINAPKLKVKEKLLIVCTSDLKSHFKS